MTPHQRLFILATTVLASLALAVLVSPWHPSPRLHAAPGVYLADALDAEARLVRDPLAVLAVLASCGFWRIAAAPALAGAAYAVLFGLINFGSWAALGFTNLESLLAACTGGFRVCALAALTTALVSALTLLAAEEI